MPARDGTGPLGTGPIAGRGRGLGRGAAGRGRGLGQGGARRGAGGVNTCVCPKCGNTEPHKRGVPCTEVKCAKCGTSMRGDFCMPTK